MDAEIFYFDSNLNVVGVADAKVLRLPGANKGTRSSFKTVAGAVVANGSCTGIEGAARVVDLRARDSRYVKGGGVVDASGRRVGGAKGENRHYPGAFNRSSQHHGLSLERGRDGCGDGNGGGT